MPWLTLTRLSEVCWFRKLPLLRDMLSVELSGIFDLPRKDFSNFFQPPVPIREEP